MKAGAVAIVLLLLGGAAWYLLKTPSDPATGDAGGRPQDEAPAAPPPPAPPAALEGRGRTTPGEPALPTEAEPLPSAPPGDATARLVVTWSEGGRLALPRPASVVVRYGSGREVRTEADQDGKATFDGLPPGEVSVIVHAEGFTQAYEENATLTAGGTEEVRAVLVSGEAIAGRAVDGRSGLPVADAVVSVRGGGEFGGTTTTGGPASYGAVRTDAEGRFRTPGLPFDFIVTLSVKARGYRRFEKSILLQTVEGARAPLEIRLEEGGVLRGTVRDPDGKPVENASVFVAREKHRDSLQAMRPDESPGPGEDAPHRASTDAGGAYVLEGLALDVEYCAIAVAPSRIQSRVACGQRLTLSRPESSLDLPLTKPGVVVVVLQAPGGEAIPTATLRLGVMKATVDNEGKATFDGVSEGEHVLFVEIGGFLRTHRKVAVPEGATVDVPISLDRGVSLSGVVIDDEGRPVKGASVGASRYKGEETSSGEATTDAAGRFEIRGLTVGAHLVEVDDEGTHHGGNESSATAPASDLRLVLGRKAQVKARFVLPAGALPPEEFMVGDYAMDGSGGSGGGGWTDGIASWSISAGKRILRVTATGFVPWEREIEVLPAQDLDLGEIPLDLGIEISGRVTDPAGRAVAGAVLKVETDGGSKCQSGEDGRFRLEHVGRGAARISVTADGFLTATVLVDAPRATANVRVLVHRGGRLVAVLRDPAGAPATDLRVHVHLPTPGDEDVTGTWAWENADEKGRVEARLLAGAYLVEVLRDEVVVASAEVVLEEGKDTPIEIQVPPP